MSTTLTPQTRFRALVVERARLGLQRYGPDRRPLLELVAALSHEAIDAANYAAMELQRLDAQYPDAVQPRREAHALALLCAAAAELAAEPLARLTGGRVDVAAVAHERMHGPAAGEYGYDNFLYRDNFAELVEELADAVLLCQAALAAHDQHGGGARGWALDHRFAYDELKQLLAALAAVALTLGDQVAARCPPPARTSTAA